MELKLGKKYMDNLEKCTGEKIQYIYIENGIEFICDMEIQYQFIKKESGIYEFLTLERGKVLRKDLMEFKSHIQIKRKLTLILMGLFGEKADFSKAQLLEKMDGENTGLLDDFMEKHIGEDYYSINNPQIWKMNLENIDKEKGYNIYLILNSGNKIYREKEIKDKRAFIRFYNETVYFKHRMMQIKKYQKIFGDKLSNEDIDELIYI